MHETLFNENGLAIFKCQLIMSILNGLTFLTKPPKRIIVFSFRACMIPIRLRS